MTSETAGAAIGTAERSDATRAAAPLLVFAGALFFVGSRHEAWVDEAQAWLIARDSTLWDLLAHRVRYEGTPGLWHAILWLLSHAGFPYGALWLVSSALALLGAAVVMLRAPFPFWLRVAVIFSYFFAYQYAVVARSYALDLVFFPLIAAAFARRLERPVLYCLLLGLCANSNVHSFIVAGCFFAEFAIASGKNGVRAAGRSMVGSCAVFLVLAGAAVLQAWPPPDESFSALQQPPIDPARAWMMIREAFLDRLDFWSAAPPGDASIVWGQRLSILLLLPSCFLLYRAGRLALALALILSMFAFSTFKVANVWHAGMLYLSWVLLLWISWDSLARQSALLRAVIVGSIAAIVLVNDVYTAAAWRRDVEQPYSAGPAAAHFLANLRRGHPGERIAAAGLMTFAIQPWSEINQFANYRSGSPGTAYYTWQTSEPFQSDIHFDRWRETVGDPYDALILSTTRMSAETIDRYVATAILAGFCKAAELPGGLIWKNYVREDDSLVIFERCATIGSTG